MAAQGNRRGRHNAASLWIDWRARRDLAVRPLEQAISHQACLKEETRRSSISTASNRRSGSSPAGSISRYAASAARVFPQASTPPPAWRFREPRRSSSTRWPGGCCLTSARSSATGASWSAWTTTGGGRAIGSGRSGCQARRCSSWSWPPISAPPMRSWSRLARWPSGCGPSVVPSRSSRRHYRPSRRYRPLGRRGLQGASASAGSGPPGIGPT